MVSSKIEEGVNEAKEALDNIDQLGALAFDICDGKLSNNKAFIHDKNLMSKIEQKETMVYEEYRKRLIDARAKLKDVDPLYQWDDGLEFYMKLRRWKSMEMITFWDKLSKQHDI